MMKLTFYGGAKTVTGANYLLEVGDTRVLIDCGLFQGPPELQFLNSEEFKYDPASISHVFITHSHQDHCGRIPKLVSEGFKGEIVSTEPTKEMMEVALEDSAHLIAMEAEESGFPPIYAPSDVDDAVKLMRGYPYDAEIIVSKNMSVRILNAGHILGSAMYQFTLTEGKKRRVITFTGDIGNHPAPLLPKHSPIDYTDYLVMESVYGDRVHEPVPERNKILTDTIKEAINNDAVLLIPSFAIERTQVLLYEINKLAESGEIKKVPMFIDSPLAIKMTRIYQRYTDYFNYNVKEIIRSGDDIFKFPGLEFTETKAESKKINHIPAPKIILAGSGMSTGGRILYHEQRYLEDPKNYIFFVGYQAFGTLGRKIFEGEPVVEIFGHPVKVHAHIRAVGGFSAHADQPQLVEMVRDVLSELKNVYIVQGEREASFALKEKLESELGVTATVPKFEEVVEL